MDIIAVVNEQRDRFGLSPRLPDHMMSIFDQPTVASASSDFSASTMLSRTHTQCARGRLCERIL